MTIQTELSERAVRAVKTYVIANYATHVAAVNAYYAALALDAITISNFPDTTSVVISEAQPLRPTPTLAVLPEAGMLDREDPASSLTRHQLSLVLVDSHPEQDTLQTMMMRHGLALYHCLKTGQQDGVSGLAGLQWRNPYIKFSQGFPGIVTPGVLFAGVALLFNVQVSEVFP